MKKTILTLITASSSLLFATQTVTSEALLLKVQQEIKTSILYQEKIAQREEIEAGVHIAMNLSKFCKNAVPIVIDKYMLLQNEAFAYGNANPEVLDDGTLVLPEKPLSKEFLQNIFIVGAKLIFSEEADYEKLRFLTTQLKAKKEMLSDLEDEALDEHWEAGYAFYEAAMERGDYSYDYYSYFDYSSYELAKKTLEKEYLEEALKIVKNSSDPLLSKFLYPLYEEIEEDVEDWVVTHFVQYNRKRLQALFGYKEEPINALEEKMIAVRDELRQHMLDFSKNQKKAMTCYLTKCLMK